LCRVSGLNAGLQCEFNAPRPMRHDLTPELEAVVMMAMRFAVHRDKEVKQELRCRLCRQ